MSTPEVQTQSKSGNSFQESVRIKEELDKKPEIGEARARISEVLGHSIGARFFRVVALGALLVGAAVLYSSISQGEAGSPSASTAASQTFEVKGLEAEISGVPSPASNQTTASRPFSRAQTEARIEAERLEDPHLDGMLFDMLMGPPAGSPLSREQMAARVEAERLEDPHLDGMLFDMLMGPPAGRPLSGE